jgi:hypothetical protein
MLSGKYVKWRLSWEGYIYKRYIPYLTGAAGIRTIHSSNKKVGVHEALKKINETIQEI